MEQFLENTFNTGDPELRRWFLIRQSYLPFVICGIYVLCVSVIGPAIMKNRKPFDLRKPMIAFNFVIVATYIINVSVLLWNMPKMSREELCKGSVVRKGEITYMMASKAWVIYLLKYVELLDTVFFVLRKKENQITFLHVLHHSLVPILGWIMFRTEKSALQSIPLFINSFVHIIMYTYYGLAAMGPHVRKYLWWKKYLTQLQLVQFVFFIVFVTIIAPLSGCEMSAFSYIIDAFVGPLFLYLFYRFYKTNFQTREKSMKKNEDLEKDFVQNGSSRKDVLNNNNAVNHKVSSKKLQKKE